MAASNGVTGAFALDVNAVSKLKYSANKNAGEAVHETARQFEAMFIKQMLSSMRDAIPKSHLLDSSARDQYQDMMDAQWSQTLARRGIGLADMLTRQLAGQGAGAPSQSTPGDRDRIASIARAQPKPLAASESLATIKSQRELAASAPNPAAAARPMRQPMRDTAPLVADTGPGAPLLSLGDIGPAGSKNTEVADHVRDFVDRLGSAADGAARRTGLSSRLILAQAALETGWGRHEITTDTGRPSYNVFNIKADGWGGASADVATHEFTDGALARTRAGFRVYDSYQQAFDDYARLIDQSPRYATVRAADSPAAAARALQDSGYATDPNYADKLVSVMSQIPVSNHGGLFAGHGGRLVDLDNRGQPIA